MNKDTKELLKLLRKSAKPAGASSVALALAACGGGGGRGPITARDDGITTVAVLDDFSRNMGNSEMLGPHGDSVVNSVERHFDGNIVEVEVFNNSNKVQTIREFVDTYNEHEVEVINTSYGKVNQVSEIYFPSSYSATVRELWDEHDVFVVAAAGNDGNYGATRMQSDSVLNIIVGSTGNNYGLSSYTNYHPSMVDFYTYGAEISDNGALVVGTSFASPKVAGMVAELIEANPDYTMAEIRTLLELNSTYKQVENHDTNVVFNIQEINDITTTEHVINTRVIVEAAFELFADMNPNQTQLDMWVSRIDSGDYSFQDLRHWIEENPVFDYYTKGVSPVEKIAAHYHWYEHREATDEEILFAIDNSDIWFGDQILPVEEVIA